METLPQKKSNASSPNFSLLMAGLESQIVEGRNIEKCHAILDRKDVWFRIGIPDQLKWARLAQMAGKVDTALNIFAHINQVSPSIKEVWEERLDLLDLLGRQGELIAALAASRNFFQEEIAGRWKDRGFSSARQISDKDVDTALAPFEALRNHQAGIRKFLELFSGREDCFARQWSNKQEGTQGYVPVRRPMSEEDVEDHLSGRKTYGIYIMQSDGTIKTAVIDVDITKEYRKNALSGEEKGTIRREYQYLLSRLKELGEEMGIRPLHEFSGGKGFHFWFFFAAPVEAGKAKRFLEPLAEILNKDLSSFHLEVFPKQDKLTGKGLGNLVKLPLGIHRQTGKRSHFVECANRSMESQLAFLTKIEPASPGLLNAPPAIGSENKVVVHPRWRKWAEEYPELFELERLCPPLGQIFAVCRNGKTPTNREEKILLQTVGFLPRAKALIHHLMAPVPEYNPHLVDFKLSRLRGTPLGCKRIHSLLEFNQDICTFEKSSLYAHPLLHLLQWEEGKFQKSERVENLNSAMENLSAAIAQVQRFMT